MILCRLHNDHGIVLFSPILQLTLVKVLLDARHKPKALGIIYILGVGFNS
jgi:hypothetical protein